MGNVDVQMVVAGVVWGLNSGQRLAWAKHEQTAGFDQRLGSESCPGLQWKYSLSWSEPISGYSWAVASMIFFFM